MTIPQSTGFTDAAATWNSRFQSSTYLFGTEANSWLKEYGHVLSAGQRVLSVADGEGRNSVYLASLGLVVDAFDIAELGVAKARKLAETQGVTVNFLVSDCDQYAWTPNGYDGVAAIFIQFADPEMRKRLFSNIKASLKVGGYLILQGYTPQQLEYKTGGPSLAAHLYTRDMLELEFSDFDILELREYEENLNEGTQHAGRSALIGLVARKRI